MSGQSSESSRRRHKAIATRAIGGDSDKRENDVVSCYHATMSYPLIHHSCPDKETMDQSVAKFCLELSLAEVISTLSILSDILYHLSFCLNTYVDALLYIISGL